MFQYNIKPVGFTKIGNKTLLKNVKLSVVRTYSTLGVWVLNVIRCIKTNYRIKLRVELINRLINMSRKFKQRAGFQVQDLSKLLSQIFEHTSNIIIKYQLEIHFESEID